MNTIKPAEASFFSYCMKHLDFINLLPQLDWRCIVEYSEKHNVPMKLLYSFIDKWDRKGIAHVDMIIAFKPSMFPMEYIMLIPRKVMRTTWICPMHAIDASVIEKFEEAYRIKTLQCGEQDASLKSSRYEYMNRKKLPRTICDANKALDLLLLVPSDGELYCSEDFWQHIADNMSNIVDIVNAMRFDDAHLFNKIFYALRKFVDNYPKKIMCTIKLLNAFKICIDYRMMMICNNKPF